MEIPRKTPVNEFNKNAKYTLETNWGEEDNFYYRLFKRVGDIFIEIDSFNNFQEANEEAKEVIRRSKYFSYLATE